MLRALVSPLVLAAALGLAVLPGCTPTDKDGGADSESDGAADGDADGDGYGAEVDCDDSSAAIHPGADERCDGLDNDCDGTIDEDPVDGTPVFVDSDGDGHGDPSQARAACGVAAGTAATGDDCDDGDPAVFPGATERCSGRDDDCDGLVDDEDDSVDPASRQDWFPDGDGDGPGQAGAAAVAACADPGAAAGATTAYATTDDDCDDGDPAVHPGATEVCDADDRDEDCDGLADDADPDADTSAGVAHVEDRDGDGHGDASATPRHFCDAPPAGWTPDATDCDDGDPAVHPGATEVCDPAATDEDCDGLADDADDSLDPASALAWSPDLDGDGYGDAAAEAVLACLDPSAATAHVADATDCDDSDPAVHPGATEVCDADDTDEDCSGLADDADPAVDPASFAAFFPDTDGDGHGDSAAASTAACDAPAATGWSLLGDDCDDADAAVSPSATEVCDADDTDEDCSGLADDADPAVDPASFGAWTVDADLDGYGDASGAAVARCDDPSGGGTTYADNALDCDDGDAAVSPAATEVCDEGATDEDCDGDIDDDDADLDTTSASAWTVDADLDGHGDASASPVLACADPSDATTTYVDDATDCDDSDADINPLATEIYGDGIDQDCAGVDHPTFSCTGYNVPGAYSSIGAAASALGESSTVQTICLRAQTYTENPTIRGNLRIVGPATDDAVINGHVTINTSVSGATVELQGLTVKNGVELLDNGGVVYDTTLSDCIIEVSNQYGVFIDRDGTGTPNTTIERCTVHGKSPDAAVYLYDYSTNSTDRITLVVQDAHITGGAYGIRTAVTSSSTRRPMQTIRILRNTIDSASYGIYAAGRGSPTTFQIYNNIITGNSRGFAFNGKGNMSNDHNLYWANTSADFYLSASGGANRITADPVLSSDSPPVPAATGAAAGAGTTAHGGTVDWWSNARSSPPSVGAVEPF